MPRPPAAGGAVLGGYTPLGWSSSGQEQSAASAFLFIWPGGDMTARPFKLQKARRLLCLGLHVPACWPAQPGSAPGIGEAPAWPLPSPAMPPTSLTTLGCCLRRRWGAGAGGGQG